MKEQKTTPKKKKKNCRSKNVYKLQLTRLTIKFEKNKKMKNIMKSLFFLKKRTEKFLEKIDYGITDDSPVGCLPSRSEDLVHSWLSEVDDR